MIRSDDSPLIALWRSSEVSPPRVLAGVADVPKRLDRSRFPKDCAPAKINNKKNGAMRLLINRLSRIMCHV